MSPSRTPVTAHRSSISNTLASNAYGTPNAGTISRRSGGGSTFSSSDLLQTKLRSLLNTSIDHGQPPDAHYSGKMMPDSPSSYDQHLQYISPKKLSHQEVILACLTNN